MPSKSQYDLVQNDDYDIRIPLHPEEAFHHGITFNVKYIGSLDIPRPKNRVEIVAAMRRIRYEFKANGVKKKKVTIEVSIDGVKVTLRKKRKRKHYLEESSPILLAHPIYRIFYVSHDSQDLKIFSYIARDGHSNVFKCAVFKSNKKGQAMRVVRTIGQAFEVCHKLSITGPEMDYADQDEDIFTQDLVSDRFSDVHSDKSKKDMLSDVSEKKSEPDENSYKDNNGNDTINRNRQQLNENTIPINNPSPKKPNVDRNSGTQSNGSNNNPNNNITSGGNSSHLSSTSALSTHHELQLLKEQLDQQMQQTQAAFAQLQLVREQLAAEQSARMEAQARTQQLLVHNKELLDHIAALVSHLQGSEKTSGMQQNVPHMNIPQPQPQHLPVMEDYIHQDHSEPGSLEHSPVIQGLIENRAVTSCLPPSPIRTSFNPSGGVFNFSYPTSQDLTFEAQLLQRLQTLCGYTPPPQYSSYNPYNQTYLSPLFNHGSYTLQPPPQKKLSPSLHGRHSYSESPASERRFSPARSTDEHLQNMQQVLTQQSNHLLQVSQNIQQRLSPQQLSPNPQSNNSQERKLSPQPQRTSPNPTTSSQNSSQSSSQSSSQQRMSSRSDSREAQFIKPLSQMGTLTTTDTEGRVRVIVPIPANSSDDDNGNLMASPMRLGDDLRRNITRSTSEKVPHRSELMSQVQRTAWARHTTK